MGDHHAKFLMGKMFADKESDNVYLFIEEMLDKYGTADTILADNGGEFTAKIVAQLLASRGIEKLHGRAFHPQTQGFIEKSHQVSFKGYKTAIMQAGRFKELTLDEADKVLEDVRDTYNHSKHSVTGIRPYEVGIVLQNTCVDPTEHNVVPQQSFRGQTDFNWNKAPGTPYRRDLIFSENERTAMYTKATAGMMKQGSKEIARIAHRISKQNNHGRDQPLEPGRRVLITPRDKKKTRHSRSRWVAIADVVSTKDDVAYKIKWVTKGPNKEDLPGTISSRPYNRGHLAVLPKNISLSKIQTILEGNVLDVFPVSAYLAKRYFPHKPEWRISVHWDGWSLDKSSWEPRYGSVNVSVESTQVFIVDLVGATS